MNYREAIQLQISALQEIYDNAGYLRDHAGSEVEKTAFNEVRRTLPMAWRYLQALDNNLPDLLAREQVKGDYQLRILLDQ